MSITSNNATAAASSNEVSKLLNQIQEQQKADRESEPNPFEQFTTTFFNEIGRIIHLFETLQKIPPDTHTHHSDRLKSFIVTAPNWCSIPGAQQVANVMKQHDHERICDMLSSAAQTIRDQQEKLKLHLQSSDRKPFYRTLYRLRTAFDLAVTGEIANGGLHGVIKTYQTHANMKEELTSIESKINQYIPSLQLLHKELDLQTSLTDYCPEEDFSDLEWDQLCKETVNQPIQADPRARAVYSISLTYNQIKSWLKPSEYQWWNKIEIPNKSQADKGELYLGALPVEAPQQNTLDDLKKEGICAVLSMVDPFENQSQGFVTSAIIPNQLQEAQIKQLQIPMTDFKTGSLADVQRGVAFIRWNICNGRSIYVHCKAGRGRSALIVASYLIKYHSLDAKQALELIKKMRPQAGFDQNDPKMSTLTQYEKLMLQQRAAERN